MMRICKVLNPLVPSQRILPHLILSFACALLLAVLPAGQLQAQSCCSQFDVEILPIANKPCCFSLTLTNIPAGTSPCELKAVQISAPLNSGVSIVSASAAGSFAVNTGSKTAEWTIPPSSVFPNGTMSLGTMCFEGIEGCATLRLRFYDGSSSSWVCEKPVEVCCYPDEECCSFIEPKIDFVNFLNPGCSYTFSIDILPGAPCDITQIRLTSLGGTPFTSVVPFVGITGSNTPPTNALFSKNSGTWGVGNHAIATFDMQPQTCERVRIEYYEPNSGEWICARTIDVCCPNSSGGGGGGGGGSCCSSVRTIVEPTGDCCFRLKIEVEADIQCELTEMRITFLHQADLVSAGVEPGFGLSWNATQMHITNNNTPFNSGQSLIGEFCTQGWPYFTFIVEFYDLNTQSWICFEEYSVACEGFGETFFPGSGKFGQAAPQVELVTADEVSGFAVLPNPSSESSIVSFNMTQAATVDLALYSLTGQEVLSLHSGILAPGMREFGVNVSELPSGQYFVRLKLAGGAVLTRVLTVR